MLLVSLSFITVVALEPLDVTDDTNALSESKYELLLALPASPPVAFAIPPVVALDTVAETLAMREPNVSK